MARVNVYLPDDLAKAARHEELSVSHEEVIEAIDAAREELGAGW